MKKSRTKLSIIIPVRNEGKNISNMIIALNTLKISKQILIIYDFSNDDTLPVVNKLSKQYDNLILVQNKLGKGVANAIRSGINKSESDYILILAADDMGPIKSIKDMVYLMDQGCDFVSCTRYCYGGKRDNDSFLQKVFSRTGNKLFNLLSGSVFTDLTTGFKMFRSSIFDKLKIESDSLSWSIVFEMAIKAQSAGMKLGEVPVRSSDRKHGKSTFRLGPWFKEYVKWFFWGITHLHGKKVKKPMIKIPEYLTKK